MKPMLSILKKTVAFSLFLVMALSVLNMVAPYHASADQHTVSYESGELLAEVPSDFLPAGKDQKKFTGTGEEQIQKGVTEVTNWIRGVIGAIAILMLVIGGAMYVTARGDDSKMAKGKTAILGAIIGLVVVVLAGPIQEAVYSGGKGPDVAKSKEIVLNLVKFFQGFIGIIAVAMIVYGGFQIITARGEESKFAAGKKSLLYAVIGLFVVSLAQFAVDNVIYPEGRAAGQAEVDEGVRALTGVINWALGFVGIVAVAIMIYGGSQMIIARGEEGKYAAGKKTLTYAVIGLMLVIISYSIVGFVFNAIGQGG